MKKLFENWRQHLQEEDTEILRRNILNEISEDEYEYIKNWMRDAPDEAYSFNKLFDGKKRIAITPPPPPAEGDIGNLTKFFEDNGYTIDFKDSQYLKILRPPYPKAPELVRP